MKSNKIHYSLSIIAFVLCMVYAYYSYSEGIPDSINLTFAILPSVLWLIYILFMHKYLYIKYAADIILILCSVSYIVPFIITIANKDTKDPLWRWLIRYLSPDYSVLAILTLLFIIALLIELISKSKKLCAFSAHCSMLVAYFMMSCRIFAIHYSSITIADILANAYDLPEEEFDRYYSIVVEELCTIVLQISFIILCVGCIYYSYTLKISRPSYAAPVPKVRPATPGYTPVQAVYPPAYGAYQPNINQTTPTPVAAPQTVDQQLDLLNIAFRQGIIDEQTYHQKRMDILSNM